MTVNNPIGVLHIDSERGWRGGQQQVAYLLERMHRLGFNTALACRPGSPIESFCRDREIPCFPVAMRGEMDFGAGFSIAALCRKHGFTIAHLHSAHALATGHWAKLFHGKLHLVAVRRVDFHLRNNLLSRLKYMTPRLDKVVCISEGIKRVLLSDGVPESRLTVIHSGVDLHKFDDVVPPPDFRQELGIPENHILVGTVAAIVDHKDYPTLLHAARKIIERTDNISFCAVGSGGDEKEIHALAARLGLGNRFVFTGFRKDVGRFLKCFDIFVLSSHLEGLGTSILDAQSVGLPVVACRTGGIPEIVHDHENGFLVPIKAPDAMAEAILKLAADGEMRCLFGKRGMDTAAGFSIDITVEKNIALYRQLLSDSPA